jgi:hypothetical protein
MTLSCFFRAKKLASRIKRKGHVMQGEKANRSGRRV